MNKKRGRTENPGPSFAGGLGGWQGHTVPGTGLREDASQN